MKSLVEVSARHIHLKSGDYQKLFGNKALTKRNDLSQRGEFASNLTCELVGPKGRLLSVRVLGPLREYSQVEISRTDCFSLGIDAPYLESGDDGGELIKVIGSHGELTEKIAIVAMRHIHLSPSNAESFKLSDGDFIEFETKGKRATKISNIIVRVAENFDNHIHLDTDDANAADIENASQVEFFKTKDKK